jgi:hypothetical protein
MKTKLKVKVLNSSFVYMYVKQFTEFYNNHVVLTREVGLECVKIPVAGLDFGGILKGNKVAPFSVVLERFDCSDSSDSYDLIKKLSDRNTDRTSGCKELEGKLPLSIEELVSWQERADNLDGFMWGLCLYTAEIKGKERQLIDNTAKFEREVRLGIRVAGVVVC